MKTKMSRELVPKDPPCVDPALNRYLTDYCFADLSDHDRRLFEAHLIDCDFCWEEVQRLSSAVSVLRFDKSLMRSVRPADLSLLLGMGGRLDWLFAGHTRHVVAACVLYALLYVVGLMTEVSYAFDKFGAEALKLAPLVFLWIIGTSMAAAFLEWRRAVAGRRGGLALSVTISAIAAIVLYAALCFFLPDHPITQMRIQAYTAQGAYLKGIRYTLPLAIIFFCVPYHFVVIQQAALRAGRHGAVLALLTEQKWAVSVPGAFYITVRTLWLILLAAVLASIPMTSHLFDNLEPGRYMNLFTNMVQVRWLLYFGLGLECLAWYTHSLNDLKRECAVVGPT